MGNKVELFLFILLTVTLSSIPSNDAQGVHFPDDILSDGSECTTREGLKGTCMILSSCHFTLNRYHTTSVSHCFFKGIETYVCCPSNPADSVKTSVVSIKEILKVPTPNITTFECGLYFPRLRPENLYSNTTGALSDFYRLNRLLEEKQKAGYAIRNIGYRGILVLEFIWNDGQEEHWELLPIFFQLVLGGTPARYALSRFSALLGQQRGQENRWHCDGVLINDQWILTAAHCFNSARKVEVVRLGEYDYNNDTDIARPEDFGVTEVIRHPQYQFPLAYHDLALVKLSKKVVFSRYINPVCLPWGDMADIDLVGSSVTLSGWGATTAGGSGSSLLQEVNVTVFETTTCDASYSDLAFYSTFWPNGIREGNICAGDEMGGKDACQGDSGGPIVYLDETHPDFDGKFTLAGIVSKGHGCGDSNFPGIYMDVRHGPYLSWIKEVAFGDY